MNRYVAALFFILTCLVPAPETQAQEREPNRKKVVLRNATGKGSPPRQIIDQLDARIVQEYPAFTTIDIHENDLPQLMQRAAAANVGAAVRDDFDVVQLPGGHIDTRRGMAASLPGKKLGPAAVRGRSGLYLLQFAGPIAREWEAAVVATGIKLIQYVPYNAYIVTGRPDDMNEVSRLPFVQFVDVFHASLKSQEAPTVSGIASDLWISIANVAEAEALVKELSRLSHVDIETSVHGVRREELRVRGTFMGEDVERIANERLVFAVSLYPQLRVSDERAAMSLTPHVDSSGVLTGSGGRYKAWLESVCPGCTTLETNGFKVGMADTGFWYGPKDAQGNVDSGPADLPNSRVTYGKDFIADSTNGSTAQTATTFDDNTAQPHGTFVASIIAGDPSSGADSAGFLYGMGIAPSAELYVTKINAAPGSVTAITKSAHDARSAGVYIQNHSYNQYVDQNFPSCETPVPDGRYSIWSRDFDAAVLDSNNNGNDGATPITLVVSAGNRFNMDGGAEAGCSQDPLLNLTLPPGTAKNVIAVGGTETPRTSTEAWNCRFAGIESLNNVELDSKRGTLDSSWFKPDLMAPAGNVTGLRHDAIVQEQFCGAAWNQNMSFPSSAYAFGTGTSFSAPVGSGAALLASRAYSSTAGAASPALIKAMLVMSARSMKGGKDHADRNASGSAKNPVTTIGALPSQSQGFGRIHLENLLEPYPARSYFNQTSSISGPGNGWSNTYKIHDGNRPVTIVLAWSDTPAQVSGIGITNPLVNDLDLSVFAGTSCTQRYLGNNLSSTTEQSNAVSCTGGTFDRKNNVEYIRITGSAGSTFTVNVDFYTGSGSQNFALALHNAYDADDTAPPATPTNVSAQGASSTSATITWNSVTNATRYEVRIWSGGPYWKTVPTTTDITATSHTVTSLSPMTTYLFAVRAVNGTGVSQPSAAEAATTFASGTTALFTDDPLVSNVSAIKAQYITELRQAVNAHRATAGLTAYTFTDSTVTANSTNIKAVLVQELRTALDAARQALGLTALSYTDATLSGTNIKAVHLQELRNAVK